MQNLVILLIILFLGEKYIWWSDWLFAAWIPHYRLIITLIVLSVFFSILCFYLVQVFFVIYKPKQNYKQIELETADIMTATLITLLPFPTELLHSNKVRFAPQLSWCWPCSPEWAWSNCEYIQLSIWPQVSVCGQVSHQVR